MSTTICIALQNMSPTRTRNPVYHCLYVLIMSSTYFKVNLRSIVAWISRILSLETGTIFEARPVWPNGWVFVYELSGCGFESCCSLPVYHHHKRINFLSKDIPSFGIYNSQMKIELKNSRSIHWENFKIRKSLLDY